MGKRSGFHLQVDFSVNVCRVQRDVTQPSANRVDIDTGAEKMHGRGVPNRVDADAFAGYRWGSQCGRRDISPDEVVYSEASHRLLSSVQEDSLIGRPPPNQLLQNVICERPQGTDARLVALSRNSDHR